MEEIKVKKRHTIKKSEIVRIKKALGEEIGEEEALFTAKKIEIVETTSAFSIYLVEKKPVFMAFEDWIFPTVRGAIEHPFTARRITVDSGAVPYVMNGADIMRPGIVAATPDIRKDHPCIIAEQRYGKPLAVGVALYDATDLMALEKGKTVRTVHRVGDQIWNLEL